MPEVMDFVPWQNVKWDNMNQSSGGGFLAQRPYYFKMIGSGRRAKILLVSAVPSKNQPGTLHAVDYLRFDQEAFRKLTELGTKAFGI